MSNKNKILNGEIMKVNLNNKHSPCTMCFIKGVSYDSESSHCQSCEYNIAIKLLKRMLKEELYCSVCKNSKSLGGGYWDCTVSDDENYCKKGDNLNIDWEIACGEYGIETV